MELLAADAAYWCLRAARVTTCCAAAGGGEGGGRGGLGRGLVAGQRPLLILEMLLREHLRDGLAVGFVVEAALLLERQQVLGLEETNG